MNEFANVTVSTLCFPTDGRGAVSAIRGAASAVTTVYTANTVTDTAAAWTLTGVVAGDYAFTEDGYWGIVQSYSPAAGANVLTVDRWRKAARFGGGLTWAPTAGQLCTVHSTSHIAGSQIVSLKKIICLEGGSAETLAITDQKGVAITGFTFGLAVGTLPGVIADYGEAGIQFLHPIGFKMSGTGNQFQIVYDATGPGPAYL